MTHEDKNQLRLLSRLHYLGAVLALAVPLFGTLYGAVGIATLLGSLPVPVTPATHEGAFGWAAIGEGVLLLVVGVVGVGLNLMTARSLPNCKNYTLCVLTSGVNCMHFPFGTLLGLLSILVLCRPAVSAAFRSDALAHEGPERPGCSRPPRFRGEASKARFSGSFSQ